MNWKRIGFKFLIFICLLLFAFGLSVLIIAVEGLLFSVFSKTGNETYKYCLDVGGVETRECKDALIVNSNRIVEQTAWIVYVVAIFITAFSYRFYFRKHLRIFLIVVAILVIFALLGTLEFNRVFGI